MRTGARILIGVLAYGWTSTAALTAQEMPADYEQVLSTLGKQGDFKDHVQSGHCAS